MRCVAVLSILWGVFVLLAALPMMATRAEREAYVALRSAEALVEKNQDSTTVSIETATLRSLNQGLRIRGEAALSYWMLAGGSAVALILLSALYLASGPGARKNRQEAEQDTPCDS